MIRVRNYIRNRSNLLPFESFITLRAAKLGLSRMLESVVLVQAQPVVQLLFAKHTFLDVNPASDFMSVSNRRGSESSLAIPSALVRGYAWK